MRPNQFMLTQICSILGLLLCLFVSTQSCAIERPFPADAKVGELSVSTSRTLMVDGNVRQLTAGAQIRTQQNTIIQPQTLLTQFAGSHIHILYTENTQGQIHRMWLLTREEAEKYPLPVLPWLPELPLVPLSPATIPDRTARGSIPAADEIANSSAMP